LVGSDLRPYTRFVPNGSPPKATDVIRRASKFRSHDD
jgi:hypothetical protein